MEHRERLVKDSILVVEGVVSHDDYNGALKMRARAVMSLSEARAQFASALELALSAEDFEAGLASELEQLLAPVAEPEPGLAVVIRYQRADASARLRLPGRWRVRASDETLGRLRARLGSERVRLCYGEH